MMRLLTSLAIALAAACTPTAEPARLDAPLVDIPAPTASATPVAVDPTPPKLEPPETTGDVPAACRPAIAARDLRRIKVSPRSEELLTKELEGLERLVQTIKPNAPDRPQVLRRLAEDYSELSCASAKAGDAPAAKKAHDEAAKCYDLIADSVPSYGTLDEVLYYGALEHELAGDLRNARSRYYQLIAKQPQSKLVPAAYFAFGEMFYAEAQQDPSKWPLAKQAYIEVSKYPKPGNTLYDDAQQRLADVRSRGGSP
jgi:tetratricopeptide (TPR) repeat protein